MRHIGMNHGLFSLFPLFAMGMSAFLLSGLFLGGCATMNASECRNADWELIGFEDGAEGRIASYLGNHRKACAQYDITPDLSAYMKGHANGVRQYCTEANGFLEGMNGKHYQGVCPPDMVEAFLDGYTIGRKLHDVSSEIESLKSDMRREKREIDALKDKIKIWEEALVKEAQDEGERRRLLSDINESQRKIGHFERKILEMRREIDWKQHEYDQLRNDYEK